MGRSVFNFCSHLAVDQPSRFEREEDVKEEEEPQLTSESGRKTEKRKIPPTSVTDANPVTTHAKMTHYTDTSRIASIVSSVRAGFDSGVTQSIEYRKGQLQALRRCLLENREKWTEGVVKDLRMDKLLQTSEVDFTVAEIDGALKNIDQWVQPESVNVPLSMAPAAGYIIREPLGVVLNIAPWNYPVSLLLKPLVGIIAAGNAAVLKPSEVSHNTSENVANLVPKYLDPKLYAVVCGGVKETTELLKQKFDHIIYTGNGTVAKIVARAAAEHLTPVTLELGGKSPVVIDDTIDIPTAAKRLVWGKFLNCGQTCVAPDYILAKRNIYPKIMAECVNALHSFYGKDAKVSKDYGKIINDKHTQRIADLVKGNNVYYGGDYDVDRHYFQPTLVDNPKLDSKLMSEEIFGPVLPFIPFDDVDDAIKIIKQRAKPLALYIFSQDTVTRERVLKNTSSGGGGINETVNHVICKELPFGGVGDSGVGSYNGKHTFLTFSHKRSILSRSGMAGLDPSIRFPPYSDFNLKLVKVVQKLNQPRPSLSVLVGLLAVFAAYFFWDQIKARAFN